MQAVAGHALRQEVEEVYVRAHRTYAQDRLQALGTLYGLRILPLRAENALWQ